MANEYEYTTYQFEEVTRDLLDLCEFKELTILGTEALATKYRADQEKKQALILEHERQIRELNERIAAEDAEISQKMLNQVIQIIDDAQLVGIFFKLKVDRKSQTWWMERRRMLTPRIIATNGKLPFTRSSNPSLLSRLLI